jgi:hypothetical protein
MPMPASTVRLEKPKLLIGEGKDEVNFFTALLKRLGIAEVQVEEYGGKPALGAYLKELRTKRPGRRKLQTLAVTRDLDVGMVQDYQSVCSALTNSGLAAPPAPGQFIKGKPSVGVYLFPDNQRPGMLEDLCLDAAAADPALPCVDDFIQCIADRAKRSPVPLAKARMHAWLASQDEPDLRLGEATQKLWWPWNHPAFDALKQFLHDL